MKLACAAAFVAILGFHATAVRAGEATAVRAGEATAVRAGEATAVRADEATGELRGAVFNATCPGPCRFPPPPLPLFEGDGLTVVIRRLPERELVARLHPEDGLFAIDLAPGLYRVRAFVGSARRDDCWEGSTRRKLVEEGLVTRVRLKVTNICVL